MIRAAAHIRAGGLAPWAVVCLGLVAACAREDEGALRARVAQWASIGETLAFHATPDCAAAVFRLTAPDIKSAMPVAGDARTMLVQLRRAGRAALAAGGQSPDAGLVEIVNADRATGMAMRRAALEGRACMDEGVEDAFLRGLKGARSILAWDGESGTVMILDPDSGLVTVAMGGL